jgi:hypothetical protein
MPAGLNRYSKTLAALLLCICRTPAALKVFLQNFALGPWLNLGTADGGRAELPLCICLARSCRFCVAQVSKPAVSPTSKSAPCIAASGFGNPRHSRLGSLRYAKHIRRSALTFLAVSARRIIGRSGSAALPMWQRQDASLVSFAKRLACETGAENPSPLAARSPAVWDSSLPDQTDTDQRPETISVVGTPLRNAPLTWERPKKLHELGHK